MFTTDFQTILVAPLHMLLMGIVGYFFVRRRIIPENSLGVLNDLLVCLFLPALIFHDFFTKFTFSAYGDWWIYPLLGVVVSLAGLALGKAFVSFLQNKEKKDQFLSLCAFQNSGYIPLVIAQAILPAGVAEEMYVHIFLFLVGFNFLIWSLGAKLISGEDRHWIRREDFNNPPVLATMVSLVVILTGLQRFVPSAVVGVLDSFGNCTMPVAIFVVGGSLATVKIRDWAYARDIALAVAVKLFIFPAFMLAGLFLLKVKSLLGLLLVIQAAAPSAVTLTVITKYYKKDETFINQTIFYSHIIGLVTFPLFLILYQHFVG